MRLKDKRAIITGAAKKSPLRRIAEPVEIAYGTVFLAFDKASFITGSGITIDGGLTLRT